MRSSSYVFFGLETTGSSPGKVHQDEGIISISAVFGHMKFHQYVIPACDITSEATKCHGVSMTASPNKTLLCDDQPISSALETKEALAKFLDFLRSILGAGKDGSCGVAGKVSLVAHNCHPFHSYLLCRHLSACRLSFDDVVSAFLDTADLVTEVVGPHESPGCDHLLSQLRDNTHVVVKDAEKLRNGMQVLADFVKEELGTFLATRCRRLEFSERMLECFVRQPRDEEDLLLTAEQEVELREAFNLFDKGGKGFLTAKDLRSVMKSLGQEPSEDELQGMITLADTEGDGRVDFDEFVAMMIRQGRREAEADRKEEIREAFRVLDVGGNGLITAEELRRGMKKLGEELTEEEAEEMIREADADGDGHVNFQDFVTMLASM